MESDHGLAQSDPIKGCLLKSMMINGITINGINQLMESDWTRFNSPKLLFNTKFIYLVHSLIIIIRLKESIWVRPKVIVLSGAYCILWAINGIG